MFKAKFLSNETLISLLTISSILLGQPALASKSPDDEFDAIYERACKEQSMTGLYVVSGDDPVRGTIFDENSWTLDGNGLALVEKWERQERDEEIIALAEDKRLQDEIQKAEAERRKLEEHNRLVAEEQAKAEAERRAALDEADRQNASYNFWVAKTAASIKDKESLAHAEQLLLGMIANKSKYRGEAAFKLAALHVAKLLPLSNEFKAPLPKKGRKSKNSNKDKAHSVAAPKTDHAVDYLEFAHSCGFPGAYLALGRIFEKGLYVPQDLKRAEHCFLVEAKKGNPDAIFYAMRIVLSDPARSKEDKTKSFMHMLLLADKEHYGSCLYVADLYRSGLVNSKVDHVRAGHYYQMVLNSNVETCFKSVDINYMVENYGQFSQTDQESFLKFVQETQFLSLEQKHALMNTLFSFYLPKLSTESTSAQEKAQDLEVVEGIDLSLDTSGDSADERVHEKEKTKGTKRSEPEAPGMLGATESYTDLYPLGASAEKKPALEPANVV
jgi:TPR repeat protein